jgi:hypothetical protein
MTRAHQMTHGRRSMSGNGSVDQLSTVELGELRTILSSENTQQRTHDLRRLVGRFLSLYDDKIDTVYTQSMFSQWSHGVSHTQLSDSSQDEEDGTESENVSPTADGGVGIAPG